ncbi:MAG: cobalt-zinc-cadmium efflux system membrane fusion protein [Sulfurimonas sp.]|jgi:cobalt-zinc-cadmium efflux system membrane fusion protein|uniref:efflux RND transporter periplasmic adaptor subunit n=1 Tax=Sulfurimonas sp. TaxID=2022749 RepID=UPI0039E578D0
MNKIYIFLLLLLALLSGCSEDKKIIMQEQEKSLEPIVITDYSEQTELFVEFDPFVLNQASTFLAHFTHMDTFKAFKKGSVEACLTFTNNKKECFIVSSPAFEGIFKPVAIPTQSGEAELSMSVSLNDIVVTHHLGSFTVYETKDKVPLLEEEDGAKISYLKEQQWKVDYATEIVKSKTLRESISTFAKVEIPSNHEYLMSAPVSGIVTLNEKAYIGNKVQKNMSLAYITPLLAQKEDVSTLKFELKKASINLNLKKNEYKRLQKLKAQNAVSQKRLSIAQQEQNIAKAQLANIKQRLNRFDTNSNKESGISLKSLIDGQVSKISALDGSYVNEGDQIAHILNPTKLLLNVNIPQSDIYKVNKPLGLELITSERTLDFSVEKNAKFLYFSDVLDAKTKGASLYFEVDNTIANLKAGASYSVKAYTGKKVNSLAIPKSAIVNDNGRYVVYVQIGGESFERRNIKTGLRDGNYVEVLSGVSEGEHIVSTGAYQVLLSAVSPAAAGSGHAH